MAKKVEKVDSEKIRIYSKREGDIQLASCVVKFEQFCYVTKSEAEWLLKSYPEYIKRVD